MTLPGSLILSDKNIVPTEDYVLSKLGRNSLHWISIMNFVTTTFNDVSGGWNYYNDGKQWLYKSISKKKTIFWAALMEESFRITFWFGDKAEPFIDKSYLPDEVKENFKTSKKYGSIRAVSIEVRSQPDVDNVLKLIEIKKQIK